jgi:hypothetical protein
MADELGEQFLEYGQPLGANEPGVLRLYFRDYLQRVVREGMPLGATPGLSPVARTRILVGEVEGAQQAEDPPDMP